jgi:hypothetical protein
MPRPGFRFLWCQQQRRLDIVSGRRRIHMCALRLAQKIKPSGQLLQPGCQAAPSPLGVRGVAVAVAEQAYPAGEVVEVPAQSVEGDDGGVERPVASW